MCIEIIGWIKSTLRESVIRKLEGEYVDRIKELKGIDKECKSVELNLLERIRDMDMDESGLREVAT